MSTIKIEAVASFISIMNATQGFKHDWVVGIENISLSMGKKGQEHSDEYASSVGTS
jgi:hypothetical protein